MPQAAFEFFLDDTIIDFCIKMMNKKIHRYNIKNNINSEYVTDKKEIFTFLAILLMLAINKPKNISAAWKKDGICYNPLIVIEAVKKVLDLIFTIYFFLKER